MTTKVSRFSRVSGILKLRRSGSGSPHYANEQTDLFWSHKCLLNLDTLRYSRSMDTYSRMQDRLVAKAFTLPLLRAPQACWCLHASHYQCSGDVDAYPSSLLQRYSRTSSDSLPPTLPASNTSNCHFMIYWQRLGKHEMGGHSAKGLAVTSTYALL